MTADWSELPDDILCLIVERLKTVVCFAAFRSVCRSWRTLAPNNFSHSPPPQPPWVILPNCTDNNTHLLSHSQFSLFGLNGNNFCNLDCAKRYIPIASSGTWVIFYYADAWTLQLINPLSQIEIQLPSHMNISSNTQQANEEIPTKLLFTKVILSSSTPLIQNLRGVMAVGIHYDLTKLGFLRLGDKAWTPIEIDQGPNSSSQLDDLIFYNQQLYVVNALGSVFVCDIMDDDDDHRPLKARKLIDNHFHEIHESKLQNIDRCYLVEVNGDLMLVLKFFVIDLSIRRRREEFRVFKLDLGWMKWKTVKSLGQYSLFLGRSESVALMANENSCFREDSIYCSDRNMEYSESSGRYNMLVYDIKGGFFWPLQEGGYQYWCSLPIWIIPRHNNKSNAGSGSDTSRTDLRKNIFLSFISHLIKGCMS